MKKTRRSLFISTILMVVLLVVAISTATFAWYSSQNTVNAQGAQLVTASTTDANIGIFFEGDSAASLVTFDVKTGIHPMVPTTDPTVSTTGILAFNEGILTINNQGQYAFKDNAGSATPWTTKKPETDVTKFYLQNLDTDAGRKVVVTPEVIVGEATFDDDSPNKNAADAANIKTEAAGALRVAMYTKVGDTVKYQGTFGTGTAVYGVPAKDDQASGFGTSFELKAGVLETFDAVGGGTPVEIIMYAWLEGPIITAKHALVNVPFSVSFVAGNPTAA